MFLPVFLAAMVPRHPVFREGDLFDDEESEEESQVSDVEESQASPMEEAEDGADSDDS